MPYTELVATTQPLGSHQAVSFPYTELMLPTQATSDAVRFLDERKAGMTALLDRTVKEAMSQIKVSRLDLVV